MIRINLLPHRQQKKAAHRLRFQILLGATLVTALLLVGGSYAILSQRISTQEERNQFLQQETAKLDQQIKDIGALKKQRDELLARKQLVEKLQAGRNESVHIFDQLTRQTPDGVYLKSVKQSGSLFTLTGYALSGARVSNYMRTLAESETFGPATVVEVKASIVNNQRVNEFTLTTNLRQPLVAPQAPTASQSQGAKQP
ncbi:MAG TPA: PilN domain-containing protein [Chromobacteriaceae bacterium]|nr:PilN domain-containing protein [Chromobacteriaceae bacterium]